MLQRDASSLPNWKSTMRISVLRLSALASLIFLLTMSTDAIGQDTASKAASTQVSQASQPIELFDGKSLKGWNGDMSLWRVEEGSITGVTTADKPISNNTFLVWQDGKVGDFVLTLEYRIQGGNSGIQYRSKLFDAEKFIVGGYQADIDSNKVYTGINYEERGRGIMATRGQIVSVSAKGEKSPVGSCGDPQALIQLVKDEDWNRYRIVAKGNLVQHYINDVLMSEVVDHQNDVAAKEGILAFQLHQGPPMKVQFRNILLSNAATK